MPKVGIPGIGKKETPERSGVMFYIEQQSLRVQGLCTPYDLQDLVGNGCLTCFVVSQF